MENLTWLHRAAKHILCATTLMFAAFGSVGQVQAESGKHQSSRDWHRKAEEFRTLARQEIREIPALNTPMEKLSSIQTQRNALQKERQALANQNTTNRQAVLQQFHTLLQEDMKLADKSREISHQIVDNMPEIRKQIEQRRTVLAESLLQDDQNTTATAEVRRRIRYIDFLQRKLNDIANRPERIDLLARMLRGAPRNEPTPPQTTDTQARVTNLQQRRESLERQLREIDLEIRALEKDR